jgi:hypothetical protein
VLLKRLHAGVVLLNLLALVSFFSTAGETTAHSNISDKGWRSLFDGKTLKGWAATGNIAGWGVEDGAIACLVKGGDYLYTTEQFENYTLSAEFKVDAGVNSGIFVRWSDLKDAVNTGIEIQVLDSYGKPSDRHACGAIYDIIAPRKQTCKPAGEWNKVVITCNRNVVAVEMNGEKIAQMDLDQWTTAGMNPDGTRNKFTRAYKDLPRNGHIGLQDHGGRVWFRNIMIKAL